MSICACVGVVFRAVGGCALDFRVCRSVAGSRKGTWCPSSDDELMNERKSKAECFSGSLSFSVTRVTGDALLISPSAACTTAYVTHYSTKSFTPDLSHSSFGKRRGVNETRPTAKDV